MQTLTESSQLKTKQVTVTSIKNIRSASLMSMIKRKILNISRLCRSHFTAIYGKQKYSWMKIST